MFSYRLIQTRSILSVIFISVLFSGIVSAKERDIIKTASSELTKIEKSLKRKDLSESDFKDSAGKAATIRGDATKCVSELEKQEKTVEEALASLGEPVAKEPRDVSRKRRDVKKKLTDIGVELNSCRVMILRSNELLVNIEQGLKSYLEVRLLVKGPGFFTLLRDNWNKPQLWFSSSADFIKNNSGLDLLTYPQWLILSVLLALTIGSGILIRTYLCNRLEQGTWAEDFASRFTRALLSTLANYTPHLLGSTAAAIYFFYVTKSMEPVPFVTVVAIGLPPLFTFIFFIKTLLAPTAGKLFVEFPSDLGRALARRLQVLAILAYLGYLLFATLLAQSLPEPAFLITRGVFAIFLILNLIWALGLFMRWEKLAGARWLSRLTYLALLAALVIELIGYRKLSLSLVQGVLGTILAIGALVMLSRLFREFFDKVDQGKQDWNKRLRKLFGLKSKDAIPGLMWLRFITALTLWIVFAYLMLQVWDVSDTIIRQIQFYLTQGFMIGSLQIIPVRFVSAILTIAAIFIIGGWLRKQLRIKWLKYTHYDRGAREAMVTMAGYLVFAIAILAGLSVAGFEFGNIALIAGALSVGIGFGLQNIVNNFISGLILLFERPIKTGDWVVVGNTEGHVKRIRIRSTQIQTFDRADVIVPNSELISNQVTNWMLHDPRGRLRLSIGVAYGSDTSKVKEILENIAKEHPQVISDGSVSEPRVLFRGFGDSSLDFELRAFIRNIDDRMRIISDLNFAIDAAFRENDIEIPFPQRDIHIKQSPKLDHGDTE